MQERELVQPNANMYLRYLIGRARHYIITIRQKQLKPYHISPRQTNVLYYLYNFGNNMTLADLAKRMDRGINTISIQMSRMEKDGLITKIRAIPKSNQLYFQLTEKGVNLYKNINYESSVDEIMSVLSEEERQQMILGLEKIINKVINMETEL